MMLTRRIVSATGAAARVRCGRPRAAQLARAWLAALAAALCLAAVPRDARTQAPAGTQPVVMIEIKGAIGFVAAGYLAKALEHAAAKGAPAVIVKLDTPGGLLTSTREMIQAILASPVPVVMYVAPNGSRAASAGTYMMYAAHVAAMAPGTHLGAATPISLTPPGMPGSPPPSKPPPGSEKQGEKESATASERKIINDAVAYIRSLAELRGRNADWAEKAVREAATLTANAALKETVIDVLAKDTDDLLAKVDGRTVSTPAGDVVLKTRGRSVTTLAPDWKMRLMSVITDPNIALVLLMIGIYGILFEFWNPGAILPGVVGGISLILALTALAVLPVNYAGLALLLLGIALMIGEAFSPSFGIAGIGGIAAFALGALLLFDPAQSDVPIRISWQVIAGMTALSALFFAGVLGFAVRARRRPVRAGTERMIGAMGEVADWTATSGRVHLDGELWNAQSSETLSRGQKVRVVGRTGLTLTVEPSTAEEAACPSPRS
jgi:membrane-bound serine protease (ClpP class)